MGYTESVKMNHASTRHNPAHVAIVTALRAMGRTGRAANANDSAFDLQVNRGMFRWAKDARRTA